MPLLEVLALQVGPTIAKSILKLWLKDSSVAADAAASLVDILRSRTTDAVAQRRAQRQFEAIGERVAEGLLPVFEVEGAGLDEGSRIAVALGEGAVAVVRVLGGRAADPAGRTGRAEERGEDDGDQPDYVRAPGQPGCGVPAGVARAGAGRGDRRGALA